MDTRARSRDNPVISFRMKVLSHADQFGWRSACHAFEIGKSTLYRWRCVYRGAKRRTGALRKQSTRPHHVRMMETPQAIIVEIRRLRDAHYRLGKEKIKPLLDHFCQHEGIAIISVSTIGKIITRHHLFFQRQGHTYHNPGSAYAKRERPIRIRMRYSRLPSDLGHLQMDTVMKFADGIRQYALSVMDIRSKFVLTLSYPRLTSAVARDTLQKFRFIYPVPIQSVQTDNGLEFQGVFDQYLVKEGIVHYWTYPRCPKINAFIERYNRSLQEEFLDGAWPLVGDPSRFYAQLLDYLIFFNTKRVHQGLHNQTPVEYLMTHGYFSQMYGTRTLDSIRLADEVE